MEEVEKELNIIFEKHKQFWINIFNDKNTFEALKENAEKFDPIYQNLVSELINKSNELLDKNSELIKSDVIQVMNKKILQFKNYLISPFS